MKVSVFGLGYVGSVSAAAFAADGHTVVGVDVNSDKVASLNQGRSPIVEKGLDELIQTAAANGSLRATTHTDEAVLATDLSLLCVGTPSRKNGSLDLSYLTRVCEQDRCRPSKRNPIITSSWSAAPCCPEPRMRSSFRRSRRTSGKKYGTGFGVTVNPEFLREGTAIQRFPSLLRSRWSGTTTSLTPLRPKRCMPQSRRHS